MAQSVPLPPGLEDCLMPAKVVPRSDSEWWSSQVQATPIVKGPAAAEGLPQSQGCWVNAVLASMPYLDAKGLQAALQILDHAISNVHKLKALEQLIASTCESVDAGFSATGMPNLLAMELLRAEVFEQQHALLSQLQSLKDRSPVGVRGAGLQAPAVPDYVARNAASTGPTVRIVAPIPTPQAVVERPARGQQPQVQTLSLSLQLLAREDPDCLFIVRRINKLGFKACRKLKQHFSTYGPVVRVLVAHSTVRQHGDPQSHTRRRPSSLGFVHMSSAAAVRAVLSVGEEQEVDGTSIRVQRFERQPSEILEEEESGAYDDVPVCLEEQPSKDWERQGSCFSTMSTRTGNSAATFGESEASATDTNSAD